MTPPLLYRYGTARGFGAMAEGAGSGRGRLQQVRDQVAEAAPLVICPLLQALVKLPAHGCCDPLRFALEQVHTRSRG